MKALEKDRNRRYQTANGLAMDVQRFLADEPVLAGPPSTAYRLKKFVRRNRGAVLAAGLLLMSLLAGMAGTTWGMIRADRARGDAVLAQRAEAERAEEVRKRLAQIERGTEILASVFQDVDQQNPGGRTRAGRRRRRGQTLEGEGVGVRIVARLRHTISLLAIWIKPGGTAKADAGAAAGSR